MSTLEIRWPSAPQQMWSWSSPSPDHLTLTPLRQLSRRVWLANMGTYGSPVTSEVAIKIARGEDELAMLEAEAELYDQELRYLQGTVVPVSHGLYKDNRSGRLQGALVLDYRPGGDWNIYPHQHEQFASAIRRLHHAGVAHGDLFSKGHFRMTSNGPCIVDFGRATQHDCGPYCDELEAFASLASRHTPHRLPSYKSAMYERYAAL